MYNVMADHFGGEEHLVCVLPLKRYPTFLYLNVWQHLDNPGDLMI